MTNSNKYDLINTELDDYYINNEIYLLTKKDRNNIIANKIINNVDAILELILEKINYKTDVNMLSKKDIILIGKILNKSKNILNNKTKDGETLLHAMVFFNCYDIIEILIKLDIDLLSLDNDKQNCFHRCIFLSNDKIFKLLINNIKNKDFINTKDKDGNTPLHLSIIIKNYIIIKALVKEGANIFIENNEHLTPKDLATNSDNIIDKEIELIFKKYRKF